MNSEVEQYRRHFGVSLKVPPHDPTAETMLLGSVLFNQAWLPKIDGVVSAEDFYDSRKGRVFAAMTKAYREGRPHDALSAVAEATKADPSTAADVSKIASDCLESVDPHGAGPIPYAHVVRERATLRRMLHVAYAIEQSVYEESDADSAVAAAQAQILGVVGPKAMAETIHVSDSLGRVMESLSAQTRKPKGIPVGLTSLDSIMGGLKPGRLVVIGARTSVGKTALAHQIACGLGLGGVPTMFVSLEMQDEELAVRMIARETRINLRRVDDNTDLNDEEFKSIATFCQSVNKEIPLWFRVPSRSPSPFELSAWLRAEAMKSKIRVFVVDYLGLLSLTGAAGKAANRAQEVGVATRAMKQVAMETGSTIIVPVQINRAAEARTDKVPTLSDLRDSGDIEQDADQVLLVHYPHRVDKSRPRDVMEVIVAKNRGGPAGETVRLRWEPEIVRFSDFPFNQ